MLEDQAWAGPVQVLIATRTAIVHIKTENKIGKLAILKVSSKLSFFPKIQS